MLSIFTTETTLRLPVCFPEYQPPSENGVNTERKEFAPTGSKFFPFRVDALSEKNNAISTDLHPLKMYLIPLKTV